MVGQLQRECCLRMLTVRCRLRGGWASQAAGLPCCEGATGRAHRHAGARHDRHTLIWGCTEVWGAGVGAGLGWAIGWVACAYVSGGRYFVTVGY